MKTSHQWFFAAFVAIAVISASSCTAVFFEQPVPVGAPELKTVPDFLHGVYEVTGGTLLENDQDELPFFHMYVRFEKLDAYRLSATLEVALPLKELPKMEQALAKAQAEGKVLDYYVSPAMVYYILAPGEEESDTKGMVVRLEKRGKNLYAEQWKNVTQIYDLEKRQQIQFEEGDVFEFDDVLKVGDEKRVEFKRLEAKHDAGELWFCAEEKPNQWSLLYIKRVSGSELLLKSSLSFETGHFNEHKEQYNSIVPFLKNEDNDYVLNPTDEQLRRLLADPVLFGDMRLKKVSR